ncbi:HutD family protein [Mesorhizobium sp. M1C.F.Ca.ET.193.01.1.1]|uniref:HutD/Ves family protein n=1 Tax=unclassified Mesorhizobium TaxID=325217 RepID=UPI000FD28CFF|nr:HutD family protein [Mesorhizobium sp. M1C.F.Ca.ET.210.01.1.1]TGQ71689.1 HutD family protein [Mesorhizobium sp. M1C.F.Ca.ET.212.01.1.1]TGR08431.1 HutD family protein [Mesorhizobium sp. M1C.F.Ca.ET.204.01.1.1]TGR28670.1 HutD family protein [Mesorhizobium sp. M1C.F.Ca.ET.196.01.1.1]TGR51194.1 HutD family protein [Mesorhizobium sp. M1C.F.Ca.ET.195.01.1.1]TGR65353.1 HutD family protein [Mesorhizobium sp. M1C.F.Ca.ET.192.01.1.1]TGR80052.1 HutD family protein [Mesorhizobium sp. M1C.F.Ca.ET.189.0
MRILRAAGYRVMPWKNGGGTTTEIAVSPDGAGLDDFDWRISMARVETSGPFSSFAGIDRTLSVLEGEGIVLDIAGRPASRLTAASAPLSFPGDVPTGATLIGGPITDLNVMTRRGRMTHSVERLWLSGEMRIEQSAGTTLILPVGGGVKVFADSVESLGPLDTLLRDRTGPELRLRPEGQGRFL